MLQYGGEAGKLAILAFPCNQFGNQEPGVVNMLVMVLVMVLVKQVLVKLVLVKLVLAKQVLVKQVLVKASP